MLKIFKNNFPLIFCYTKLKILEQNVFLNNLIFFHAFTNNRLKIIFINFYYSISLIF